MRSILMAAAFAVSVPAVAQEKIPDDITSDKILTEAKPEEQGWKFKLKIGGTGAFNHSSKVVGVLDGSTVQLGLLVDGGINFVTGMHRWENVLKLNEAQSFTEQLGSFVKSSDVLSISSTYLYAFESIPWLGPFGRFTFETQILQGYEVRAEDVVIQRTGNDGVVRAPKVKPAGRPYGLTSAFEPLVFKEQGGMFANPIAEEYFTLKTKAGLGFQHIVTQGGFALTDDDTTDVLEYTQLQDTSQGGVVLEAEISGKATESVTWKLKTGIFYPFFTTTDTGLDAGELFQVEVAGKLSVKLSTWLSLDYVLELKRIPLILNEVQVQNGVVITGAMDFFK